MKLPTLYKRSSVGKLQSWNIWCGDGFFEIDWGQVDGARQLKLKNNIKGKNIGKANETDSLEQAAFEARSKWKKQLDKGYSETIPAEDEKKFLPMLAQRYDKHAKKITFPAYWQPKLDGLRCTAHFENNKVVLKSRRNKVFSVLQHIEEHLWPRMDENIVFDGELYTHGEDFQKLVSAIKRDEKSDFSNKIQLHVYDIYFKDEPDMSFERRWQELSLFFPVFEYKNPTKHKVCLVRTKPVNNVQHVLNAQELALAWGYEGIMLRNSHGTYEVDRRSYNLQKVKKFLDKEYKIVDTKENENMKGTCVFVCVTETGTRFKVMPEGNQQQRQEYWKNSDKYIGKLLTVKFFEYTTSENPVPRFPIGTGIRNSWDM